MNKLMTKQTTFTISISEELKQKINKYPEINWAEYIKQRFEKRIKEFRKFEEMKSGGKI